MTKREECIEALMLKIEPKAGRWQVDATVGERQIMAGSASRLSGLYRMLEDILARYAEDLPQ